MQKVLLDERVCQICDKMVKKFGGSQASPIDVCIFEYGFTVAVQDNSVMYVIPDTGFSVFGRVGLKYTGSMSENNEFINDTDIASAINSYYRGYRAALDSSPIVASNDNLLDDPSFEEILNLKSSQGMKFYNILGKNMKTYKIPMFATFPGLNKGDTLKMDVHSLEGTNFLIVHMVIFKKAIKRDVDIIFRILDL